MLTQLRVALVDIAELRNPGRYHLKADVQRGLREESCTSDTRTTHRTPELPVAKNGRTRTTPDLPVHSFTSGGHGAGKHAVVAAQRAKAMRDDGLEPISSDSDHSPSAKRAKRAGGLQALGDDSDDELPGQRRPRGVSEPPATLPGVAVTPVLGRGSPPAPVAPLPPVVLELARTFDSPLPPVVAAAVGGGEAPEAPEPVTTHTEVGVWNGFCVGA